MSLSKRVCVEVVTNFQKPTLILLRMNLTMYHTFKLMLGLVSHAIPIYYFYLSSLLSSNNICEHINSVCMHILIDVYVSVPSRRRGFMKQSASWPPQTAASWLN